MKRFISCLAVVFLMLIYCSAGFAATAAAKLTSIKISPTSATVDAGKTQSYTITGYDQTGKAMPLSVAASWSSSNQAVGTINYQGTFTAIGAGSTTLTATCGNIKSTASATVKAITPILKTITITPANATVDSGKTQAFTIAGFDQNGKAMPMSVAVSWSSSNQAAGTITNGVFTAKSAGVTTITATSGNIKNTATVTTKAAVLNGWLSDGETSTQKKIVAAAKAENGKSSGQSTVGNGYLTDIAGGDGAKMLKSINIYTEWKKKPGTKTLDQIKSDMSKAFAGSAYGSKQVEALVARTIQSYNPNNLPANDSAVLSYLGIRKQCHEWADFIGGGEAKGKLSDIKNVRPGMGLFSSAPHAMIITEVNWKNGVPTDFKVCEANWASGWINPNGGVPWERTVSCGRQVSVSSGTVYTYE